MADTSGMQDLRGIDIDKLAKGFAEEENIFKKFVTVSTTSARKIRWYQKTSGFLSAVTTSNFTTDLITGVSQNALPSLGEQSWTRNESEVKKFFWESPYIAVEDIRDSDIDILAGNVRDIVRAVERKVDKRIWDVLTENRTPVNIETFATTAVGGDQWDAASGLNPIKDLLRAKRLIRENGYNPEGALAIMNSQAHEALLAYLITSVGSSIPSFSAQRVQDGVVMELLGLRVVVTENATADYCAVAQMDKAITWKSFSDITSVKIEDPGMGVKIRCWEEGEALLTDPGAVCLITDILT